MSPFLLLLGGLWACGSSRGERHTADDVQEESARLAATRTVVLQGSLGEREATDIIAKLLFLKDLDPARPVILTVDSPGGDVIAALAILDLIQEVGQPPTHTVCQGQAAGTAAWLVAAGVRGQRRASRQCRISLGVLPGSSEGDAQVHRLDQLLAERLAAATGQELESVRADMRVDRQFTGDEARRYGLVDTVDP